MENNPIEEWHKQGVCLHCGICVKIDYSRLKHKNCYHPDTHHYTCNNNCGYNKCFCNGGDEKTVEFFSQQ